LNLAVAVRLDHIDKVRIAVRGEHTLVVLDSSGPILLQTKSQQTSSYRNSAQITVQYKEKRMEEWKNLG
jgi:hypothetical protein